MYADLATTQSILAITQCLLFLIHQTKQCIRNNLRITTTSITNTPYSTLLLYTLPKTPSRYTKRCFLQNYVYQTSMSKHIEFNRLNATRHSLIRKIKGNKTLWKVDIPHSHCQDIYLTLNNKLSTSKTL